MISCKPKIFQLLLLDAHIDAHFEEHRQLFHQVQLLNLGVDHSLSWVDVLLLIMTIWVEKATKQQMCVITQGLNSFCISDREFGSE